MQQKGRWVKLVWPNGREQILNRNKLPERLATCRAEADHCGHDSDTGMQVYKVRDDGSWLWRKTTPMICEAKVGMTGMALVRQ